MTAPGLPSGSRAAVITVSDRSHAGLRPDASGPALADGLRSLGFEVGEVVVVPDERQAIRAALQSAIATGCDLVVTTGGTGLTPRDVTPDVASEFITRPVPGLAEELRRANRDAVPTTILSRAVAGIAERSLVLTLPGSTGAVRDALGVLEPVVGHAVAQLRGGGDH